MPLEYTKNKKHIYKWREANKEKFLEKERKYRLRTYYLKREFEIFRKILLDI